MTKTLITIALLLGIAFGIVVLYALAENDYDS